ncbi:unnamed protein product [Linum tenue]|uniref:BHLH domain-containing protein n=1 Tax=Linum tenue TaxID=586396 RepID=A0AAV0LW65_9ROSI|nr:unnamed protein product [Linum tenue]
MDGASFLAPSPPPDSQLFHYTDSTALSDPPTVTADSLKWHHQLQYDFNRQQQEEENYMGCVLNGFHGGGGGGGEGGLGEVVEMSRSPSSSIKLKSDPGFSAIGWPGSVPVGIFRTSGCPPTATESSSPPAMEAPAPAEIVDRSKKRKLEKPQQDHHNPKEKKKVFAVDENRESKTKKIKAGCGDGGDKKSSVSCSSSSSKNKNIKKENSSGDSNNSKVTQEVQRTDYIHVRARRGQATDSHSLAERVRREKISERMKYLQDLVPGCDKITGKAGMLDEIINYVQSLQHQVEFLSMKLAAVNPGMDFNIDSMFPKEVVPDSGNNLPAVGMSSSSSDMAAAYLHLNSLQQQLLGCSGLEMGMTADLGLRRTISTPITRFTTPETETFIDDSSCFPVSMHQLVLINCGNRAAPLVRYCPL